MATCPDCQREMRLAPTCSSTFVAVGKSTLDRVRYPVSEITRCDSCNVMPGGLHHFGCDMERCPNCGGQLIACTGH